VLGLANADAELLYTLERALFERGRLAIVATPDTQEILAQTGLIVLSQFAEGSDWTASNADDADLYLNERLDTAQRVELILDALEHCQII
jgi:hypothetical protein